MKSVCCFQKSTLNSGIFKFLFVSSKIEVIDHKFVSTYRIAFSVLNGIMEGGGEWLLRGNFKQNFTCVKMCELG